MRVAIAYPITPEYIYNDIDEFLSNADMNQSRLAVLLQNRNQATYKDYGFLTFEEWMKYMGYPVIGNRVWSRNPYSSLQRNWVLRN